MRKFLALLVAVGLLTFAGAAFGVGHDVTSEAVSLSTDAPHADVPAGTQVTSGTVASDFPSETIAAMDAIRAAGTLRVLPRATATAAGNLIYVVDLSSFAGKKFLTTFGVYKVAAEGDSVRFFDNSTGKETETVPSEGKVAIVAAVTGAGEYDTIFGVSSETPPTPVYGSRSSGCDAGFGALALLLGAGLFLRRK